MFVTVWWSELQMFFCAILFYNELKCSNHTIEKQKKVKNNENEKKLEQKSKRSNNTNNIDIKMEFHAKIFD